MEKLKKQLIIMCGASGSGKSTWVEKHFMSFPGYTKVISRDQIRFSMLKDDEDYFAHENEVYNKFIKEIKDGLKNCDTTIADATHLNIASRTKLFRSLGTSLKNINVIAIVIKPSLQTCLTQNEMREGRSLVPRDQVRRMYYSFDMPSLDEGFDEIWIYKGNHQYEIIQKFDNFIYDGMKFTIDFKKEVD